MIVIFDITFAYCISFICVRSACYPSYVINYKSKKFRNIPKRETRKEQIFSKKRMHDNFNEKIFIKKIATSYILKGMFWLKLFVFLQIKFLCLLLSLLWRKLLVLYFCITHYFFPKSNCSNISFSLCFWAPDPLIDKFY